VCVDILNESRERSDGTRRSPWNEIECGDHYSRPLAAWQIYELASGLKWNAITSTLSFAPRTTPLDFQSFFTTHSGWGQYAQTYTSTGLGTGTCTINALWGSINFKLLELASSAIRATATIDGVNQPISGSQSSGTLTLNFLTTVNLTPGSVLTVTVG